MGDFRAKVCRAWCILPGGPCGAGKLGQDGPGLLLSCREGWSPSEQALPSTHSVSWLYAANCAEGRTGSASLA